MKRYTKKWAAKHRGNMLSVHRQRVCICGGHMPQKVKRGNGKLRTKARYRSRMEETREAVEVR